jgi:arylsulfatase
LQAPAEEIAKFRGKYKAGWEAIAGERYAKQRELGIIDKAWAKARRPEAVQPWKDLPADEQERFDHLMAAYAAVVHRMDKAVGDLVAGLKQRGVFENTLILFMSDNGGNAEGGPKGTTSGDPSTAKSSWFCGMSWAFVENTPFRLYKHYNHEGGIATPLIAHWPAGIAAKGELRTQPAHLIDIMSTCTDVGGATYPREFKGKPIIPMEGKSLVGAFANRAVTRDSLYWEHEGNAAVRVGDLKLVRHGRDGAWELYDLKTDRTELHDLAAAQPEKAKELAANWEGWAARAFVKPYPAASGGSGAGKTGRAKNTASGSGTERE